MRYTIKAHPTKYNGVQYRSRLEARWAAFFDLIEWKHEYEPIDLPGWVPDFRVEWACGHSECDGSHVLLAEVKPYYSIKEFDGHPCMKYTYGIDYSNVPFMPSDNTWGDLMWRAYNKKRREAFEKFSIKIPADSSAAFGINPGVSFWGMSHGAGGGDECIENWVPDWSSPWKEAGNITQWRPRQ
jgi:hypothetical protein